MFREHPPVRRPRRRSGFAAAATCSLCSEFHLELRVSRPRGRNARGSRKKNLKSRISRQPRGETSSRSERKEAYKAWQGKKKPHPAVERAFCRADIQGAPRGSIF